MLAMTSPEHLSRFSVTPCRRGPQRGGPAAHPHPQGGGARADGHDGRRQHAARVVHLRPAADRHRPLLGARWGPSRLHIRTAVARCHVETPSRACHASRLSLSSAAWPLRSTTNLHTHQNLSAPVNAATSVRLQHAAVVRDACPCPAQAASSWRSRWRRCASTAPRSCGWTPSATPPRSPAPAASSRCACLSA